MLLSKTALVRWHYKTKEYFINKGYSYTKDGDLFEVPINDLQLSNRVEVEVKCDYCGKEIKKTYRSFIIGRRLIDKDSCDKCKRLKTDETNLLVYGVKYTSTLEEAKNKVSKTRKKRTDIEKQKIINKVKETNLSRYGVEYYSQTTECKDKMKQTNLERFGVEYYTQTTEYAERMRVYSLDRYGTEFPLQSEEIKAKTRATNLKKYGYKHPMQQPEFLKNVQATCIEKYGFITPALNIEVIKKKKITNLKRYGFESALSSPKVREKGRLTMIERFGTDNISSHPDIIAKKIRTMTKNSSVPTSSQQLEIYNMLKDNGYNAVLNEPMSRMIYDVAIYIGGIKIDLEYDAQFFHEAKSDRKRDEYSKSQGWKILRVRSGHLIPSLEQLEHAINKLVTTDRKFTTITLDDWNVEEVS